MNPIKAIRLRHLHITSWLLVALGGISLLIGLNVDNGEFWQLIGLMLVLAGAVKLVVLLLWHRVAGLETDRHKPIPPN